MARKVYLHVGLHKTATRFLQRAVFRQLDPQQFEYNPEPLMTLLNQCLRHRDDAQARQALEAEVARLMQDESRGLLISKAGISGDMYDQHSGFEENLEIVRKLFPGAHVLFFIRDQADWLLSAYRQSIQKGAFGPIEVFLNFYDGEFRRKQAPRMGGMRNVDALGLRFLTMYRGYVEAFGEQNVFLFRYEDMREDRQGFMARLARSLDIPSVPVSRPDQRRNRSYSALAIQLFCGSFTAPARPPKPGDKASARLPWYSPRRTGRRLRRLLIKHLFDRFIYKDWDLLARGGMRQTLEAHYRAENEELKRVSRLN